MSTFTGGTPLARGPMGGDGYTTIHRGVFRDANISAKAKGIFGYLSTHVDGWRVSEKSIANAMKDGRDAIRAGLRELEEHCYLIRGQERGEGGTWGASVWFYTDLPAQIRALGIADAELVAAKVGEAFDEWQKARSAPSTENPSSVVTSENTPEAAGSDAGQQAEGRLPRSAPLTGFPSTDNPRAANPTHKKNISKEINKTGRQAGVSMRLPDAERPADDAACLPERTGLPDTPGAQLLRRLNLAVTAQVIRQHHQAVSDLLQTWPESALIAHLERETTGPKVRNPMGLLVASIRDTTPYRGSSSSTPERASSALPPICGQCDARDDRDPAPWRTVSLDPTDPKSPTVPCPRCHPSVINNNQEDQL